MKIEVPIDVQKKYIFSKQACCGSFAKTYLVSPLSLSPHDVQLSIIENRRTSQYGLRILRYVNLGQ